MRRYSKSIDISRAVMFYVVWASVMFLVLSTNMAIDL
jgi:hypothetical protein